MTERFLTAKMPHLDGESALRLIGILDRLVEELWLLYGDEIFQDAGFVGPTSQSTPTDE